MKAKPISEKHSFWRNRVEGQIRHAMHEHPEYFAPMDDTQKKKCINSIAKRIIGEIVAGTSTGNDSSIDAIRRVCVGEDGKV